MMSVIGRPTISSAEYPNILSAASFQLVTMLFKSFPMTAFGGGSHNRGEPQGHRFSSLAFGNVAESDYRHQRLAVRVVGDGAPETVDPLPVGPDSPHARFQIV